MFTLTKRDIDLTLYFSSLTTAILTILFLFSFSEANGTVMVFMGGERDLKGISFSRQLLTCTDDPSTLIISNSQPHFYLLYLLIDGNSNGG